MDYRGRKKRRLQTTDYGLKREKEKKGRKER
jgi:hypothetical protein